MSAALGFGPIRDDDELLDRLGSRHSSATDGLEGVFASWTTSIDDDERECARHVGPLGLRRVEGLSDAQTLASGAARVKVVRVRRARAVAVLGALAITVSGGGVAAALNQTELLPVVRVIERATGPIATAHLAKGTETTSPAVVAAPDTTVLPALVAKATSAAADGDFGRALGLIEAVRSMAPDGADGAQITAQVDQLEQRITGSPEIVADKAPVQTLPPLGSSPAVAAPPATAAPTTTGPVLTTPPSTGTATGTDKPTSATTGTGGSATSGAPTSSAPSETPATTAPTSSLGTAGGAQSPGTADPSTGGSTTPATGGGTAAPSASKDDRPATTPQVSAPAAETSTSIGGVRATTGTTSETPVSSTSGAKNSSAGNSGATASAAATTTSSKTAKVKAKAKSKAKAKAKVKSKMAGTGQVPRAATSATAKAGAAKAATAPIAVAVGVASGSH